MTSIFMKGYQIVARFKIGQKVYFAGHRHEIDAIEVHPELDDKFKYGLKDVLSPIPERMLSAMSEE